LVGPTPSTHQLKVLSLGPSKYETHGPTCFVVGPRKEKENEKEKNKYQMNRNGAKRNKQPKQKGLVWKPFANIPNCLTLYI
jgi:hypothetical protein